MLWILPAIFVLVHSPQTGDSVRSYQGMDEVAITSVLSSEGATGVFISQADYEAYIAAHTAPQPTPAQVNLNQRNDAIGIFINAANGFAKLFRAVLIVLFDENNNTREWIQAFKGQVALSTSLADLKTRIATLPDMPDRTVQQAATAVQNKINSGASD